jgi:spore maturation protein CgeB
MKYKILYVGAFIKGHINLLRLEVLKELGHTIIPLDVKRFELAGNKIARYVRFRMGIGSEIAKLNQHLENVAKECKPDIIWINKGIYVWGETIKRLKKLTGSFILHYNMDDPFGLHQIGWRIFFKALPHYDLHFVPREVNLSEYTAAGAKDVLRYQWSFDKKVHCPTVANSADAECYKCVAGFVGSYEKERAVYMTSLANAGIETRVWGNGWENYHTCSSMLKIEKKELLGESYAKALSTIPINLGFLRKSNRDLSTTRSIEIPACGGFMLAERTTEHLTLFEEGKEAEFFSGADELIDKTKFYTNNPQKREDVGNAGRLRCFKSGYSYHDELARMIKSIATRL